MNDLDGVKVLPSFSFKNDVTWHFVLYRYNSRITVDLILKRKKEKLIYLVFQIKMLETCKEKSSKKYKVASEVKIKDFDDLLDAVGSWNR